MYGFFFFSFINAYIDSNVELVNIENRRKYNFFYRCFPIWYLVVFLIIIQTSF